MGTIRRFSLDYYINKYNLSYFVETGTFYGDGVEHAEDFNFKHIYSYELYKPIYIKAQERFADKSNITIINKDSGLHLRELTDGLTENCLFFFDAHFPGADARFTEYTDEKNLNINLPLFNELEQIKTRANTFSDVIIIDDYRLFVDDNRIQAQPLNEHLRSIGKEHITREDLVHFDLVEYLNKNYKQYFDILIDVRDEGYLILEPKK